MLKSGSSGLVSCEELLLLDVVESLLDVEFSLDEELLEELEVEELLLLDDELDVGVELEELLEDEIGVLVLLEELDKLLLLEELLLLLEVLLEELLKELELLLTSLELLDIVEDEIELEEVELSKLLLELVLLATLLSLLLLVEEFDAVEEFIFEALLVFWELEELFELDELPALSPQPANVNKDKMLTRATDFFIFIKRIIGSGTVGPELVFGFRHFKAAGPGDFGNNLFNRVISRHADGGAQNIFQPLMHRRECGDGALISLASPGMLPSQRRQLLPVSLVIFAAFLNFGNRTGNVLHSRHGKIHFAFSQINIVGNVRISQNH